MFLSQRTALQWFNEKLNLEVSKSLLHPALLQDKEDESKNALVWYYQSLEEKFHVLHVSGEYEELTPVEFARRMLCRFYMHCRTVDMKYCWGTFVVPIGRDEDGFLFFAG